MRRDRSNVAVLLEVITKLISMIALFSRLLINKYYSATVACTLAELRESNGLARIVRRESVTGLPETMIMRRSAGKRLSTTNVPDWK